MFVRIRGSNIRSFQVVESYRDVQGRPRQKVLGSLGRSYPTPAATRRRAPR